MEIGEYKNIYLNEGSHFFYVSTHYLVERLIRKYARRGKRKILDAGCGTGGLMKKLTKFGEVKGIDYSPNAIRFAKKRSLAVKKASVQKIPIAASTFDVVTCIDVIYHQAISDDVSALREIRRVLKPKGVLILRVPANKFLFSAHDRHVHTARRYDKRELVKKLNQAGLKTIFISYVHAPIFPLSLVLVLFERITRKSSASTIGKINPLVNTVLTVMLKLEAVMVTRGIDMPFGQGLIAVAQPTK